MNEKTVVQRYLTACREHPRLPVQIYREKKAVLTVTYEESLKTTAAVAAGLNALGIGRGEKVTVYSDNRPEWLIFNFALSGIGGVDVPRGTDTPFEELRFIAEHSESSWIAFETKTLAEKFFADCSDVSVKGIFIFSGNEKAENVSLPQYTFSQLKENGAARSDAAAFFQEEAAKSAASPQFYVSVGTHLHRFYSVPAGTQGSLRFTGLARF